MQITLESNIVSFLSMKELSPEEGNAINRIFELKYSAKGNESNKREFFIVFDVTISDSVNYSIHIEYKSIFSTDSDITEDFISSAFVKVNAPAIGYPFLRSFISTLTVNSGYNPIILPTINFVNLANELEKEKTAAK